MLGVAFAITRAKLTLLRSLRGMTRDLCTGFGCSRFGRLLFGRVVVGEAKVHGGC
jgi:hypothetical protein